jgi:hypothetical protein
MELTIDYNGLELQIEGDYEQGEAECWTLPNGDPGYPGSASSFVINSVTLDAADITELISNEKMNILTELCLTKIEE